MGAGGSFLLGFASLNLPGKIGRRKTLLNFSRKIERDPARRVQKKSVNRKLRLSLILKSDFEAGGISWKMSFDGLHA